ncbi:MAG: hypothetical protein ACJAT3_001530 [Akkermansiaceae bacterium]|jgi:hypothetical protein
MKRMFGLAKALAVRASRVTKNFIGGKPMKLEGRSSPGNLNSEESLGIGGDGELTNFVRTGR